MMMPQNSQSESSPSPNADRDAQRNNHSTIHTINQAASGTFNRLKDLVSFRKHRTALPELAPGAAPGVHFEDITVTPTSGETVKVTCTDFSDERVETKQLTAEILESLDDHPRPNWSKVRWVNVEGLHDLNTIKQLTEHYHIHPLAVEDMMYMPQRPKVDLYNPETTPGQQERTFILARLIQLDQQNQIVVQQVSIFLGAHTVLTFMQAPTTVWDPIFQRLNRIGSKLRQMDASFLVYALLDAIVDHGFPVLESYSDRLEELEAGLLDVHSEQQFRRVHILKHELQILRRHFWPMRELIHQLQSLPTGTLTPQTQLYLRDVYDHTVQILEMIESYREVSTGMVESYMSAINNRMNEIMKVLTIMASIFIPLTFLTGVYGMNFDWMPGLKWADSFYVFMIACLVISGSMLLWFRHVKWL